MLELLLHRDSSTIFRFIEFEDCMIEVVGFPREGFDINMSAKDGQHIAFRFFSVPEAFSFLLFVSPPANDSEQSFLITRLLQPLAVRKVQ
jgi:hypothetical protein